MPGLKLILTSALLLAAANAESSSEMPPVRIDPVVIPATGLGSCPSSDLLQSARSNMSAAIRQVLPDTPCGGLGWTPVVSLDLGDTSQQCPAPWMEISTPARSCTAEHGGTCVEVRFPVPGVTYSRVCGRAVGYDRSTPDGFYASRESIDETYLDGMSVTHGSPRQHIWTFASGHAGRCPCDTTDRSAAPLPPSFVGDNYFCDGQYNGALWDAMNCTTSCCTFNSPPWFTVTLPTPTTDDIEARLCSDQSLGDERIHVRLLELYVQ